MTAGGHIMMIPNVTILVSTIDAWQIMWKPWCFYINKYWPDCPWPIRFVTNYLDPPCGETIKTGATLNWTAMIRQALRAIQTPLILYIHEDCWLAAPVDTRAVIEFAGIVARREAGHIRLHANDQASQGGIGSFPPDPRLFVIGPAAQYRTCLQAAIWRREIFLGLLREGESPWDFEINSHARAGHVQALCLDRAQCPDHWMGRAYFCYQNMGHKGIWFGQPVANSTEFPPEVEARLRNDGYYGV